MKRDYGVFQVGLKILLRKGDKVLLLRMNDDDQWLDLPGGRIDNVEYRVPLEKIIAREIREELGPRVRYALGKPLFCFRRQRHNKDANAKFVFLVVYDAVWKAGDIKLSFEHCAYEWVDTDAYVLKRSDFGQGEEYQSFRGYFANLKSKKILRRPQGMRRRDKRY